VEEMSAEDVASMRFLLDRALQPIERFDGFDWIEQFQTSAVRYQVMGMSYALSVAQAARLPALRGYLFQAQRNLIDKMMDHRIWRYWALENAWGNLRLDPDPMAPATRDNVMYSGWYAAMIGMHASNTGDERYNRPGSIVLRHPSGREFAYDWPSIIEILADNYVRAPFTLFPCEPNWIYVFCNNFGAIGVVLHDRLRGSDYWSRIAPHYSWTHASENSCPGLLTLFMSIVIIVTGIRDDRRQRPNWPLDGKMTSHGTERTERSRLSSRCIGLRGWSRHRSGDRPPLRSRRLLGVRCSGRRSRNERSRLRRS